jgi:hypothetical protein
LEGSVIQALYTDEAAIANTAMARNRGGPSLRAMT